MRVAVVSTAFRTREPVDLHAHVRSLAPALARAGAEVEVFTAVRGSGFAPYAQRRTEVIDHVDGVTFGVTAIEVGESPDADRIEAGFGAFLDRERPAICHLEALDLFGTGIVREARARGITTLHCARDTWPAHDRTSLTLPDLTPFELGDGDAEARAIVAEQQLGPLPKGGGLPEESSKRDRLHAILHDEFTDPALIAALRDARETVEVRRAEKRVALSAVDRRFASSRLLARQLSATVGRAFTYRAPGVDASVLPAERVPGKAQTSGVRFTFLGTTRPIAGLSVLVDAFARFRASADAPHVDLLLALERTDPERDERLCDRAESLGASVEFTSGPVDVEGALARTDVLVLPSLWGEFSPAAPRLALAAGRPVVAARMPGIVETLPEAAVIFVAPSDSDALAEALKELAERGERYDELCAAARALRHDARGDESAGGGTQGDASGSPPVPRPGDGEDAEQAQRVDGPAKTIDAEAREWIDTYEQLLASPRTAQTRAAAHSLDHLQDVTAQLAELRKLSVQELFMRAQEGVGRLRRAFGLNETDASLLSRVVARGGVARDRAEQGAAAEAELRRSLGELQIAREAMRAEETARVRRVGDLHAVLGQYEQEALARGAEAARIAEDLETSRSERDAALERESKVAAERDDLGADLTKERERAAKAEKKIKAARTRFEEVAGEAESARNALEEAEAERELLAESVREREKAVRALRNRLVGPDGDESDSPAVDLESIEAHCVALERDVETLRRHDAWLGQQTARLVALFENAAAADGDGQIGAPTRDETMERSSRALDRLCAELGWRRNEMEAARMASESLRARLAGGALTARVQAWSAGPPPAPDEELHTETAEMTAPDVGDTQDPVRDLDGPAAALPRRRSNSAGHAASGDAGDRTIKATTKAGSATEAKSTEETEG